MHVTIWSPDCNPANIDGFTIVVDVLRAFSVSYYIAANAPERYIAIDDVDRAFALRDKIPGSLLVGERQGITVPGFDYGNSPTEILGKNFSGRTVIHTTTAGTKGLLAQKDANEVVVGSFVNAGALVVYVRDRHIDRVNIYCTAPAGLVFGEEDYLFAEYLEARLLGKPTDFPAIVARLRAGTGAGFSDTGFAPASDFDLCMQLDAFDSVLGKRALPGGHEVELIRVK
jgi:2-phosphosulfolactate phosphatase